MGMLVEKNSGTASAQNNSAGNMSVQNSLSAGNSSGTNNQVANKNLSVMPAADAQSRMQLLLNANNGEGCSVTYPELNSQKTVYHATVCGMEGNYIGDIYVNSKTGQLIKLSWLHD